MAAIASRSICSRSQPISATATSPIPTGIWRRRRSSWKVSLSAANPSSWEDGHDPDRIRTSRPSSRNDCPLNGPRATTPVSLTPMPSNSFSNTPAPASRFRHRSSVSSSLTRHSCGFLHHLETGRGNGPSSRNIRLAAIKSFMRYVEYRVPAALEQIRRILAIPAKKVDTRLVRHLTVTEMQAILDAPEPTRRDGIRDRAMMYLCFAAGLRVSELVGLRIDELTLQVHTSILIHGKGRKERCLPLWKETTSALRAWLALRGTVLRPNCFSTPGASR